MLRRPVTPHMADAQYPELDLGGSSTAHWGVRGLQLVLGLVTPLALSSFGGAAIYGGTVLLPLLWIAASAGHSFVRWYLTILAALVTGEVLWAVAWVFVPGGQLAIPLLGILATVVGFAISFRCELRRSTVAVILLALVAVGASGPLALAANPGVQGRQTPSKPATTNGPAPNHLRVPYRHPPRNGDVSGSTPTGGLLCRRLFEVGRRLVETRFGSFGDL